MHCNCSIILNKYFNLHSFSAFRRSLARRNSYRLTSINQFITPLSYRLDAVFVGFGFEFFSCSDLRILHTIDQRIITVWLLQFDVFNKRWCNWRFVSTIERVFTTLAIAILLFDHHWLMTIFFYATGFLLSVINKTLGHNLRQFSPKDTVFVVIAHEMTRNFFRLCRHYAQLLDNLFPLWTIESY